MSDSQRLFFALWPADEVRQAIHAQTKTVLKEKGKPVRISNLHITLVFLGNISKEKIPDYQQAASQVQARTFALQLDQLGAFQRAQILWLGCSVIPDALQTLVLQLNTELSHCGFVADARPYVPHVTIARKYKGKTLPTFSANIPWSVSEFSLVESRSVEGGVEYHVLQSWPLITD